VFLEVSRHRHQRARTRVTQVIVELLGLEHRVQRYQDRPALPRTELRDGELRIILRDHRHPVALAHAMPRKPGGKPVGPLIQAPEADRFIEVVDRGRVRPRRGRTLEQVDHAELGQRQFLQARSHI
jgi:hypothetical protein